MKELTVLTKNRGINSAIDPRQQPYSPDKGFEFLEAAVNVDITAGFRITRRKGHELATAGVAHSFTVHGSNGYCVFDGSLVRVTPALEQITIRTGMSGARVRYAGAGDKLFYSNTVVNGFIHNDIDYAWAPGSYAGPDTVHEYVAPPVSKHLCLYRGRMYLSTSNVLWYTEPLWYLGLNKATNFITFASDIRMVLSVGTALFVADQTAVYAFAGNSPDEFEPLQVSSDYVIEDTGIVVYNPVVLGKQQSGPVGLFTTRNAIFAALPDGSVFDVTENRLRLPYANTGNAYIKDNFYTVLIDE
jgi:hypothetical protein